MRAHAGMAEVEAGPEAEGEAEGERVPEAWTEGE